MKRIYIALVLLAIITASCIGTLFLEKKQLQEMIDMTQKMETLCREGKKTEALKVADTLHREFDGRTRTFALFLRHNELREIEESIMLLPLYLALEENDHFLAEVARCRLFLQKQLDMDLPTLQNIL